jgi:SAM-dependent methyltransferase
MITRETWSNVAPYWDLFEIDGTTPADLRSFLGELSSPVLIVGAGQGLLIEALHVLKFEVIAIDYCRPMVEQAHQRRGVRMLVADATRLPFELGAFRTVIVPTGVLQAECELLNDRILCECLRVARPNARILFGFPCPSERRMTAMRAIGICDGWRQDWTRIVDIWNARRDVDLLMSLIQKWQIVPPEEVRAHVGIHWASFEATWQGLEKLASRLPVSNCDHESYFRNDVSFSQLFFTLDAIRSFITRAGLMVLSQQQSSSETALHVLCRRP